MLGGGRGEEVSWRNDSHKLECAGSLLFHSHGGTARWGHLRDQEKIWCSDKGVVFV